MMPPFQQLMTGLMSDEVTPKIIWFYAEIVFDTIKRALRQRSLVLHMLDTLHLHINSDQSKTLNTRSNYAPYVNEGLVRLELPSSSRRVFDLQI